MYQLHPLLLQVENLLPPQAMMAPPLFNSQLLDLQHLQHPQPQQLPILQHHHLPQQQLHPLEVEDVDVVAPGAMLHLLLLLQLLQLVHKLQLLTPLLVRPLQSTHVLQQHL